MQKKQVMFFFFYNIQMNQKKYTNEYDGGNVFWYDIVYTERGFISYTCIIYALTPNKIYKFN